MDKWGRYPFHGAGLGLFVARMKQSAIRGERPRGCDPSQIPMNASAWQWLKNLLQCTRIPCKNTFLRFKMNITLSVDEQVAQRARDAAKKMGKSLNQLVRDYLEQLAGSARRGQQWAQFEARCLNSNAKLGDWHFSRDEAN